MLLEILLDTVLGLSPNSLQILFLDIGFVPCHLASASTLFISAIHFPITSASKRPIFCFACVLPPRSPEEGGLGCFFLSFGVSGQRGSVPSSSDMTLIFLQVEDDVELYQMPKRSRRDDLAKAMIGGRSDPKAKPKSVTQQHQKAKAREGRSQSIFPLIKYLQS